MSLGYWKWTLRSEIYSYIFMHDFQIKFIKILAFMELLVFSSIKNNTTNTVGNTGIKLSLFLYSFIGFMDWVQRVSYLIMRLIQLISYVLQVITIEINIFYTPLIPVTLLHTFEKLFHLNNNNTK
jgi:hypothetical protein